MTLNLPLELLLGLSLLSQQVTENLFGPFFGGPFMRLVALGVCVGLAFAAWYVGIFGPILPLQVAVYGVIAGLGSNVLHGLLNMVAPDANRAPLAGLMKRRD